MNYETQHQKNNEHYAAKNDYIQTKDRHTNYLKKHGANIDDKGTYAYKYLNNLFYLDSETASVEEFVSRTKFVNDFVKIALSEQHAKSNGLLDTWLINRLEDLQ